MSIMLILLKIFLLSEARKATLSALAQTYEHMGSANSAEWAKEYKVIADNSKIYYTLVITLRELPALVT